MMQYIQGISRYQLHVASLDDTISQDNPVRFIDAFVNSIELERVGFQPKVLKSEGRPSFETQLFLKIYLYGYLNGTRRKIEKECLRSGVAMAHRNPSPYYHSIADFRKDNPKALKQLFKLFVTFLKDADLIAGETIAIDGTKSRAHNGKKSNYNQKKIDKHKEYIEAKIQGYLTDLDHNDDQEKSSTYPIFNKKLHACNKTNCAMKS